MLELYPFRFRDPLTGKWVRARHKLEVPAIQRRYADWETTGPPEVRMVTPRGAEPFNPFAAHSSSRITQPLEPR